MGISLNRSAHCRSLSVRSPVSQCITILFSVIAAIAATPAPTAELDRPVKFDIAAQPLQSALFAFSKQANIQVIIAPDAARGVNAPALSGTLPAGAALTELLDASGLKYSEVGGTVTVAPAGNGTTPRQRLTSNPPPNSTPSSPSDSVATTGIDGPEAGKAIVSPEPDTNKQIQEIVITGSHIRGGVRSGSPIIALSKEEIDRSGFASLRDVVSDLPQNSGGGIAENMAAVNGAGNGYAASANLRGLGSNATLVLLDGHRLAPSGIGGAVDISTIPLSAISRIDILTDGASATYGSDAVGGVINLITDRDFNGLKTDIQYGGDTAGDIKETRLAQIGGYAWGSGHAVIAYEYYKRDALLGSDRSFSSRLQEPTGLTPEQRRNSVLIYGTQEFSPAVTGYMNALYSDQRKSLENASQPTTPVTNSVNTYQVALTPGITWSLPSAWLADLSATYGRNSLKISSIQPLQSLTDIENAQNSTYGAEVRIDGPVMQVPAGSVKVAFGAAFRREEFRHELNEVSVAGASAVSPIINADRGVSSAYGELSIPVVSPGMLLSRTREVDFNVSARYDRYSDSGSAVTPKVGIVWLPIESVTIRGTWGKSFHAPDFEDKYAAVNALAANIPDPRSANGVSEVLVATGGNASLGPEKATTFTVGIDFAPPSIKSLRASITYFDTRYRDRVGTPIANAFNALVDESLYGPAIQRNPRLQLLQQVLSQAVFYNYTGGPFSLSDIQAFVDARSSNLADTRQRGLDATMNHNWTIGSSEIGESLNIAYLLENKQRVTDDAPFDSLLNRLFYTPSVKGRIGLNATRGWLSGAAYLNYVGRYTNRQTVQNTAISPYTTVDGQISADVARLARSHISRGILLSLTVRNAFDRRPPYVQGSTGFFLNAPYGYDPANADPIGRFVTLRLQKRW
jgi:outer membrane receptor protein involved in Fe transport